MTARRLLATPILLAAIALLVTNDHVLKARFPGVITGKLSDFAGLIFFPVLVAAAAEYLGARNVVRLVTIAAIATAIGFIAIKTWGPAGDAYRYGLASLQWPVHAAVAWFKGRATPGLAPVQLVRDATDLVTLPALLVPIALAFGRSEPSYSAAEEEAASAAL